MKHDGFSFQYIVVMIQSKWDISQFHIVCCLRYEQQFRELKCKDTSYVQFFIVI